MESRQRAKIPASHVFHSIDFLLRKFVHPLCAAVATTAKLLAAVKQTRFRATTGSTLKLFLQTEFSFGKQAEVGSPVSLCHYRALSSPLVGIRILGKAGISPLRALGARRINFHTLLITYGIDLF